MSTIPSPTARLSVVGSLVALVFILMSGAMQAQFPWHASVGAESKDQGRQVLAFLPNELWIHAGDSVVWRFGADEIHTVTFMLNGPPRLPFQVGCPGYSTSPATVDGTGCVSTPPLVKGQTFTTNFPKTGNFKVVCLVHQNMTGVVHVLDPIQPLPHGQDFYDDEAADQLRDLLSDRQQDADRDDHDDHPGHGMAAGTGEVTANGGGFSTLSLMRFSHDNLTIHPGDTVEWTNMDPATPHTITFGVEPSDPMPPSANVTVDPDGARHAILNAPGDSAHSGFILAVSQERIGLPQSPLGIPGPTRFRVTFKTRGTYPYICALHDTLGMKGQVVVR